MAIHVLLPVPEEPTDTGPAPDLVNDPAPSLELDPFWAAVRRRRPDLPLVLLGEGPGPEGGEAR